MIEIEISGVTLRLETGRGLFSPDRIDTGTLAMLSKVERIPGCKVLDLGCGYGAVGIFCGLKGAAKVVMADNDPLAVRRSGENIELNGLKDILAVESDGYEHIADADFDLILSNPPYHADFSVPKKFIEGGFRRLITGGRMYMVTKRKEWYKRKFISVFGGVRITEEDGYFVFMAEKRPKDTGPKA